MSRLDAQRLTLLLSIVDLSEQTFVADVVIGDISDATHRALELRASWHGNTVEAEIRDLLDASVDPSAPLKIGMELAAFGQRHGGLELDAARDQELLHPAIFD